MQLASLQRTSVRWAGSKTMLLSLIKTKSSYCITAKKTKGHRTRNIVPKNEKWKGPKKLSTSQISNNKFMVRRSWRFRWLRKKEAAWPRLQYCKNGFPRASSRLITFFALHNNLHRLGVNFEFLIPENTFKFLGLLSPRQKFSHSCLCSNRHSWSNCSRHMPKTELPTIIAMEELNQCGEEGK